MNLFEKTKVTLLKRAQQLAVPQQSQYLLSDKLCKFDIVAVRLATVM